MLLKDQVVLITGANGGLGNAVTNAFLDAGASVVGVSRAITNVEFPNPAFTAISAEVSTASQARQIVEQIVAQHGKIDGLIHLVGAFTGGKSVAETDGAEFDKMFDINFRAALYFVQAVIAPMRAQKSGAIVAIGSRTAVQPVATLGAYSASKAALVSMMQTVALENKDAGIRANVVLPGTMDTPVNRKMMPNADPAQWVQPAQVAALLVHLACPAASQITGAVIPVYGAEL